MSSDLVWLFYFLFIVLVVSVANTLFIGGTLYLILKIMPKFHDMKARLIKSKNKTN